MSMGSFESIVSASSCDLSKLCIATVLQKVLTAFCFLHNKGHGHGVIKPSNIILDSKENVQLSDFGILAFLLKSDYGVMLNCSPYWLAPEINHSPNQYPFNSMAVDIWAVGFTALNSRTGDHRFLFYYHS
ncbi:Serine/threonine-protein kinase BLUS1 [Forsythia ovata]|uniref:Serine/threonine-protein kinase BLUS1 n=1 Tax=Forsythia ovata TaxID=205694 RepID=A0ABD1WMT4_9LAMI